MRAHLLQYDIAWERKEANHRKVEALLSAADVRPGDLIVLPEMFDTGFSLNVDITADSDGLSRRFLQTLARKLTATIYAGITAVGDDERGRNRALVFDPLGEEIACYDKIHPFSYGREPERFTGGDRVCVFEWSGKPTPDPHTALRVFPAICYDLRFPELFRGGLAMGAEMFVIGANWPSARQAHWRALLMARAIENQAFVLGVNRCGADPHLEYSGGSAVIGPRGEILGELGGEEATLTVALEADAIRRWRGEFPAWLDRRSDIAWSGPPPRTGAQAG